MNTKTFFKFLAAVIITGSVLVNAAVDDNFEMLTIGVGARPFGMGGTYAAIANDVNAVYWNPGGLGFLERKELTGMYSQYFNYEYAAYVHPVENLGTFGLSGYYYQYSRIPPQYSDIYDYAVMMSFGKGIKDELSIGASMKFLR